jgi:hypothetical protein
MPRVRKNYTVGYWEIIGWESILKIIRKGKAYPSK